MRTVHPIVPTHPLLSYAPYLEVFDSVSKAGLDLDSLQEVREDYPRTSFIFIYHTTKAGNFRGENAHAHEVDVIVQVADGEITSNGRFASGGKVKMGEIVSY